MLKRRHFYPLSIVLLSVEGGHFKSTCFQTLWQPFTSNTFKIVCYLTHSLSLFLHLSHTISFYSTSLSLSLPPTLTHIYSLTHILSHVFCHHSLSLLQIFSNTFVLSPSSIDMWSHALSLFWHRHSLSHTQFLSLYLFNTLPLSFSFSWHPFRKYR